MDIIPKKSLGQNFLVNRGILGKIFTAAQLDKDDIVLEIGPGTGILTQELISKAKRVVTVEKDKRLIGGLKAKFTEVRVVEGDILKFNPLQYDLNAGQYKIIGNIPYYLTSHLLRTIFEQWPSPALMIFMVQKEVAQRILAQPPHMNLLALSVQLYSSPKIIAYVSRGSFRPIPKVDSAILQLIPKDTTRNQKLFDLIRAGFSSKRKILVNNLTEKMGYSRTNLENTLKALKLPRAIRAEALDIEDWRKLQETLEKPKDS
ncbi:MAG TPA: 16S rRNA (adenine(1518)-N(6)/adenine(1519)-N(6))-dimethyltransferase RsmA [Candidatus Paceibacterota bacterium]|nr:16S rRNA (adenine(1518)-N(6)/adenine(1519)-N(6))-dimethyltransferase RsmA [Candidatus Paceibacterota bacterium]